MVNPIFDKWNSQDNEIIQNFLKSVEDNLDDINQKPISIFQKMTDCIFLDEKDLSKRKYIETTPIEKQSIKETLEILEATIPCELKGFNDLNVDSWFFVSPHVDNNDDLDDSTGYDEYQFLAFLFLQTNKHVIQTNFPKRMNHWSENNMPLNSEILNPGDIIILDIHQSHALAFSDNKHIFDMNMPKNDFIKQITPILERKAIALSLHFNYFPSREEVMEKLEEKILQATPPMLKM